MKLYTVCLIFSLISLATNQAIAQTTLELKAIPQDYLEEFKNGQKKYLERSGFLDDTARKVYKVYQQIERGYLKNHNIDSVLNIYRLLRRDANLSKYQFIKENPNSYASLYYIKEDLFRPNFRNDVPPDSLLSVFSIINNELKQTDLGKEVRAEILNRNSLILGSKVPDFNLKTDKGTEILLSSFQNKKYVLLIFWASWCTPCRENIPNLKELKKEFGHKGLQLISLSVDEDETKWLKAVAAHQMNWPQIRDLALNTKGNISKALYKVNYIPQYMLIDKEGALIYHNVLTNDDERNTQLMSILHNTFK